MAFIVYDANLLYPNTLRDLLIRISQAGPPEWWSRVVEGEEPPDAHSDGGSLPDHISAFRPYSCCALRAWQEDIPKVVKELARGSGS
jgi:hypothetical protein